MAQVKLCLHGGEQRKSPGASPYGTHQSATLKNPTRHRGIFLGGPVIGTHPWVFASETFFSLFLLFRLEVFCGILRWDNYFLEFLFTFFRSLRKEVEGGRIIFGETDLPSMAFLGRVVIVGDDRDRYNNRIFHLVIRFTRRRAVTYLWSSSPHATLHFSSSWGFTGTKAGYRG